MERYSAIKQLAVTSAEPVSYTHLFKQGEE